ncbi:MAG: acetyltransferase-like isoleucine patch superfamily enzyme [Flavobacteriaceae bacterium]|jgi:acetyltransferase-like isoleucine patch superfamily enzyme
MFIPFHFIRKSIIKLKFNNVGKNTNFLMGIEFRKPANISIGNNSVVNKRVLLDGRGGKLVIGNNVDIAQETNIWTLEHDVHDDYHKDKGGDVIIKDYVWIASRCTILPGVTIGRGAVVASNSVVTRDVPQMAIVGGVPAKIIGTRKSELKYKDQIKLYVFPKITLLLNKLGVSGKDLETLF